MPELNAKAPIRKNIGTADNVQLADRSNGMLPMEPKAASQPRMKKMPPTETTNSATAMGMPRPMKVRSTAMPARPI